MLVSDKIDTELRSRITGYKGLFAKRITLDVISSLELNTIVPIVKLTRYSPLLKKIDLFQVDLYEEHIRLLNRLLKYSKLKAIIAPSKKYLNSPINIGPIIRSSGKLHVLNALRSIRTIEKSNISRQLFPLDQGLVSLAIDGWIFDDEFIAAKKLAQSLLLVPTLNELIIDRASGTLGVSLAIILSSAKKLQKVSIRYTAFRPGEAELVFHALGNHSSVIDLSLIYISLLESDTRLIAKSLRNMTRLSNLKLWGIRLDYDSNQPDDIIWALGGLKKLLELRIGNFYWNSERLKKFATAIRQNPDITLLNLLCEEPPVYDVIILVETLLSLPKLTNLYLGDIYYNNQEEYPLWMLAIERLSELRELGLWQIGLSDVSSKRLCEILTKLCKLEYLSLSRNELTDASIDSLIDSLSQLKQLTRLELDHNEFTREGSLRLKKALDRPGLDVSGIEWQRGSDGWSYHVLEDYDSSLSIDEGSDRIADAEDNHDIQQENDSADSVDQKLVVTLVLNQGGYAVVSDLSDFKEDNPEKAVENSDIDKYFNFDD